MTALLILPVILPFLVAIITLFTAPWPRLSRLLGAIGAAATLVATLALFRTVWAEGVVTMQMGGWPAPFGISFVADTLSVVMVVLTGLVGTATAVYGLRSIDAESTRLGFVPMMHVLLGGVAGAFLTGDLFNLYVWFEVLLIASFVLLVLGGTRPQVEGAVKYVVINLLSSTIFLTALGILYGITGTLNMADLALKLQDTGESGMVLTVAMMLMVAFGVKAAVFPLFFWLPASYHTPHFAVSALFAGLLTKVGVYALFRTFTLIFTQDVDHTHTILLVVAGLTMVTGALGAIAQREIRRSLSFHVISAIGYMIMGLALDSPLALAAGIFYIIHDIIVKANLFFVGGIAHRLNDTGDLPRMGGLWRTSPLLGVLFFISAMSLAGIPPFSGFWAKLFLVKASLDAGSWAIAAIALIVGLLTLFNMGRIWIEVFWKERPFDPTRREHPRDPIVWPEVADGSPRHTGILLTMILPVVVLTVITVAIGLFAAPLLDVSVRAADQLVDPSAYIEAVLGVRP